MKITRATSQATKYACMKFHYAHAVPTVTFSYNIYNSCDEWCGAIVFGGGANNHMASSFGLHSGEVLELERVALNGKQEHTSQAVSMALKQLKKDDPLCKIVVSYSDHRQQHIGTIYQATNWIYLGMAKTSDRQYFYKGKWTHQRSINSLKNSAQLVKTLPSRENSNKFKYIYCLEKKLRKQYLKIAQPYPKDKDLTACDGGVAEKRYSKDGKRQISTMDN